MTHTKAGVLTLSPDESAAFRNDRGGKKWGGMLIECEPAACKTKLRTIEPPSLEPLTRDCRTVDVYGKQGAPNDPELFLAALAVMSGEEIERFGDKVDFLDLPMPDGYALRLKADIKASNRDIRFTIVKAGTPKVVRYQ